MLSRQLAFGLAVAAGLALTSSARAADDVIRLALPNNNSSSADVLTLGDVLAGHDADTFDVAYRYGYGGYRGGYRGGYYGGYRGYTGYRGGYYGGYRGGYYGGYRGGYYGGYRGYTGYRGYYGGYYRPYYYGSYYRPYYYGSYSTPYYYNNYNYYSYSYSPGYYSYSYPSYDDSYGYYGTSGDGSANVYPICGRRQSSGTAYYYVPPQAYEQPSYQDRDSYQTPGPAAPQVMPKADETFPYDGGPKNPVPMPSPSPEEEAKPTVIPYGRLQPGETLVSYKPAEEKKTGKWNYPAYGEKPTRGGK